jgi:vancomycin aglycone glucosyltransferase
MLICAVGTRGDVQPAVALALAARELGCAARLCVSPNFTAWAEGLGFEARPMGVVMRAPRPGEPPPGPLPDLIGDQFAVVEGAAEGCDVIVGAGAHQYAARSVAEARGLRCEVSVYAPVALPSPQLAPPGHRKVSDGPEANAQLWADYRRSWDERSLARVNANRARLGLAALEDGYGHILGDAPWLAADAVLGPAPETPGLNVVQTGAWMLRDESLLPGEVEAFLQAGEPPVYLGFGSMPAPGAIARTLIEAARAVGRRMVLSAGWAELAPIDGAADCLTVGDLNHAALFARVAAVAHHGGAGTTAAAAMAGAPQVVAPMFGDQFYWAERVRTLGIGAAAPAAGLTVESLAQALDEALRPEVAERARAVATRVSPDGAMAAARRLGDA